MFDSVEFDRYIVYLEASVGLNSHAQTKIKVTTTENSGVYYDSVLDKTYTNKCFFISIYQGKNKLYNEIEIGTDPEIFKLMSEANFVDLGNSDKQINLSDFDAESNWKQHFDQVKLMCESSILFTNRIEIYFGTRESDGSITTEPFPVMKFNSHIVDPNFTIRILQLPDHYNCIVNTCVNDFFHPSLLEMSIEEINFLRDQIILNQSELFATYEIK